MTQHMAGMNFYGANNRMGYGQPMGGTSAPDSNQMLGSHEWKRWCHNAKERERQHVWMDGPGWHRYWLAAGGRQENIVHQTHWEDKMKVTEAKSLPPSFSEPFSGFPRLASSSLIYSENRAFVYLWSMVGIMCNVTQFLTPFTAWATLRSLRILEECVLAASQQSIIQIFPEIQYVYNIFFPLRLIIWRYLICKANPRMLSYKISKGHFRTTADTRKACLTNFNLHFCSKV